MTKWIEEKKGRIFSLDVGRICISVHRHVHYPEDTWLLSSRPFFNNYVIQTKDLDKAKQFSLEAVWLKFNEITEILDSLRKNS